MHVLGPRRRRRRDWPSTTARVCGRLEQGGPQLGEGATLHVILQVCLVRPASCVVRGAVVHDEQRGLGRRRRDRRPTTALAVDSRQPSGAELPVEKGLSSRRVGLGRASLPRTPSALLARSCRELAVLRSAPSPGHGPAGGPAAAGCRPGDGPSGPHRGRARRSPGSSSATRATGSCSPRSRSPTTRRCRSSGSPRPTARGRRLRRAARDVGGPRGGAHARRRPGVARPRRRAPRCSTRCSAGARELGVRRVFCLTFEVAFFARHGFRRSRDAGRARGVRGAAALLRRRRRGVPRPGAGQAQHAGQHPDAARTRRTARCPVRSRTSPCGQWGKGGTCDVGRRSRRLERLGQAVLHEPGEGAATLPRVAQVAVRRRPPQRRQRRAPSAARSAASSRPRTWRSVPEPGLRRAAARRTPAPASRQGAASATGQASHVGARAVHTSAPSSITRRSSGRRSRRRGQQRLGQRGSAAVRAGARQRDPADEPGLHPADVGVDHGVPRRRRRSWRPPPRCRSRRPGSASSSAYDAGTSPPCRSVITARPACSRSARRG